MVGLDPHAAELGDGNNNAAGAKAFCLRIIEATSTVAVAYKPNAAFFEAFGVSTWSRFTLLLWNVCGWLATYFNVCLVTDVPSRFMFFATFKPRGGVSLVSLPAHRILLVRV